MTPIGLVREGEHIGVRELLENLSHVLKRGWVPRDRPRKSFRNR